MALTSTQSAFKDSREALMQAVGAEFRGNHCRCPWHPDKHASAGVFRGTEGWRFKCQGCGKSGDVFDILAEKEGRSVDDVLAEHRGEPEPRPIPQPLKQILSRYPTPQTVYSYTCPETKQVELTVVRYEREGRKQFAQLSPYAGGWLAQGLPVNPLYNRTRVERSDIVIVCEGEKAVHAFANIDLVATTSPGGSLNAAKADWSPLKGKTVYIWPDNDPNGLKYAEDVRQIVEPFAKAVYQINPADLDIPEKGDIVEYLQANEGSPEEQKLSVQLILRDCEPLGAKRDLKARLDKVVSGDWVNIEWPWYEMTWQAQALIPETVTAICGDPGAAKSFMMLEAFTHWHVEGVKMALFMLEDDKAYHMNRVLAQLAGNSLLTNLTWVKEHPEQTYAALDCYGDLIESFGKCVYDAPKGLMTLPQLADWFEEQCKEGAVICGIDPVTAAKASEKPWIDDQKFIFRVQEIASEYHSRLVYTIHPRIANGKVGPSLSRMAGGAAYARFSHSVFWIVKHETPQQSDVYSSEMGKGFSTHERSVRITKARNGSGAGNQIAFTLNPDTLRFIEHGTVIGQTEQVHESNRDTI